MILTKLWAKVTLQQRSLVVDEYGQPGTSWVNVATINADPRHLRGLESLRSDVTTSVVKASFRVRSNSVTRGITAGMRLVFQNVPYNIIAVLPQGRNDVLDIAAERVTDTPVGG
jgi:SPP1 family predicted phage head-tail adaptor